MTLEADERLRLRRQGLKLEKGLEITLPIFLGMFYGKTAGAMAGFTIDQRQSRFSGDLFSVNRHLKVFLDLIVFVTFGEAVIVADVVGVQPTDNQLLIFTDGQYRMIRPEAGEIGAGADQNKTE